MPIKKTELHPCVKLDCKSAHANIHTQTQLEELVEGLKAALSSQERQ